MKTITILGSTGSIGMQTLDVVRKNRDSFAVHALSCHSNIDLLEEQVREFDVKKAAVFNEEKARELQERLPIEIYPGIDGIIELASHGPDHLVVNSLVGSIGIRPTIAAIKAGKDIALANKETLVAAGEIVMNLAEENDVNIFPVDSEHSAVFQCLQGEDSRSVKKIILTCSGGALRDRSRDELSEITPRDALAHPSWYMGDKITIDSATLMNKGFEVIEAKMLFDVQYHDIDVVIHPQSIIHSLVEFADSSVMAQLSSPDMRLPIQYALTYPERMETATKPLNLAATGSLTFQEPDTERFPCLAYAYEAGETGGTMPCVLNAANEVAVSAFLKGSIGFNDIAATVRKKMDDHEYAADPCIEEILELDFRIKNEVMNELHMEGAACG